MASSNNDDTTNMSVNSNSIYLSFDATDSSIPDRVFKVLNGTFADEDGEGNAFNLSHEKTIKVNDADDASPLGAASPKNQNVLRGYNSHCSTPTKVPLVCNVELEGGNDLKEAPDQANLGIAFMRMADADKKHTVVGVTAQLADNDENKENEKGSALCGSPTKELVTSLIKKLHINSESKTVATEKIGLEEHKIVQQAMKIVNTKAASVGTVIKPASNAQLSPREFSKMAAKVRQITKSAATKASVNNILDVVTEATLYKGKSSVDKKVAKKMIDGPMVSTEAVKEVGFGSVDEKRPLSNMGRMSKVLPTTLNSPICKMARKSTYIPSSLHQARRTLHNPAPSAAPSKPAPAVPFFKSEATGKVSNRKHESKFICSVCSAKFNIKSILDAHKRMHEGDGPPAFCKKPFSESASKATSHSYSINQCQFCDKKFALVHALHIHLLKNCPKIPPQEKRKLNFTELDHVEKAPLPTFFNRCANESNEHKKLKKLSPPNSGNATASVLHSKNEKSFGKTLPATSTDTEMAPPSLAMPKQKVAHFGFYRKQSKTISCIECNLSFKNMLDLTNHSLEVHATIARTGDNRSEASALSSISDSANAITEVKGKE